MTPHPPDLCSVPFFSGLSGEALRFLTERLELRRVLAGQAILQPGQFGDFWAWVQSGQVILRSPGGGEKQVEPGGSFGEAMLRYGVPASYSARAARPTILWVLPRAEWLAAEQRRLSRGADGTSSRASGLPGGRPQRSRLSLWPAAPWLFVWGVGLLFLALVMLGPRLLPAANHFLIRWALRTQRADLAVSYLKVSLAWQPDPAGLQNDLGDVLYGQGDLAGAIAAYEKALAADETLASAQNNLGVALLAAGRAQDARLHFQQAAALNPGAAAPLYNLGDAHLALGQLDLAAQAYARAYELAPWMLDARARWAGIAAIQGRKDEARRIWSDLLTLQPGQALANQGLGMLAVWQNHPAEALPYLEAARAADPNDPLTRLYLGMALEALDRPQEAAAEYGQALALSQATVGSGAEPPDRIADAGAPATFSVSLVGLALQAQQRLLQLLPRLAAPTSLQSGGSPGIYP